MMGSYAELLARVKALTGPDREVDAELYNMLVCEAGRIAFKVQDWSSEPGSRLPRYHDGWLAGHSTTDKYADGLERYTGSIDAAIALVERVLPGWAWKFGTCCVSDDAWLTPDFNSPIHGERLQAEFPNLVAGSLWDRGVDIDRRPAGNVPLAIITALLTAIEAKEAGE